MVFRTLFVFSLVLLFMAEPLSASLANSASVSITSVRAPQRLANRRVLKAAAKVSGFATTLSSEGDIALKTVEISSQETLIVVDEVTNIQNDKTTLTLYIAKSKRNELLGQTFWLTRNTAEILKLFKRASAFGLSQKSINEAQAFIDEQAAEKSFRPRSPDLNLQGETLLRVVHNIWPGIDPENGWNVRCQRFINEDGDYGSYGTHLKAEISKQDIFFDKKVAQDIVAGGWCDNFKEFSFKKKIHFYVYLMASMAMGESSCNPSFVNERGQNGYAYGLFQIGTDYLERVSYGCGNHSPLVAKENLSCSVKILAVQLENRGIIHSNQSYWEVLRPNYTQASRQAAYFRTWQRVKNYSACWGDVSR